MISRVGVRYDGRDEFADYTLRDARRPAELNRLWRAMMLATTTEVLEALLRGEAVPVDRLDPEWVAKLGRRDQ